MSKSISRRKFLARSAPAFVLLAPGALLDPLALADRRKKKLPRKAYYVLQPEWNRSKDCNVKEREKPDDCHGCKACHKHARNKVFATRRAVKRAHPGCKCRVIQGGTLDVVTWAALFGGLKDPRRRVVDKRRKRTQRVLRRAQTR